MLTEPSDGGSLIPSEYQQVEFIQSSGAQIITVEPTFIPNAQITIECESVTGSSLLGYSGSGGMWFGHSNGRYTIGGQLQLNVGAGTHAVAHLTYLPGSNIILTGDVNGVSGQATGIVQSNLRRPLSLFGTQSNASTSFYYASAKVYRLTMEGYHDLIPCYRKSDGVIGMFDLITEAFLTNEGSGSFTKGADV